MLTISKKLILGLLLWLMPSIALAAVTFTSASNNSTSVSSATTITFSGVGTGTASGDRITGLSITLYNSAGGGQLINSVTLDGFPTTCTANANDGNNIQSIFCWKLNTSGTTSSVGISLSGTCIACFSNIIVYAITGADTTTPITATSTAVNNASDAPSTSVTVPSGGALLTLSTSFDTVGANAPTWTNATLDQTQGINTGSVWSVGSTAKSSSTGSITVTATWPAVAGLNALSLMAFQAAAAAGASNKNLMMMGVGQ